MSDVVGWRPPQPGRSRRRRPAIRSRETPGRFSPRLPQDLMNPALLPNRRGNTTTLTANEPKIFLKAMFYVMKMH